MDKKGSWKALTFWMFRTIYRLMSGTSYEPIPFASRPFGRAAALHIASRSVRGPTGKKSVSKAMRLVLTGNALPLRTTSYLGMDSGIGSPIAEVMLDDRWLMHQTQQNGARTRVLTASVARIGRFVQCTQVSQPVFDKFISIAFPG